MASPLRLSEKINRLMAAGKLSYSEACAELQRRATAKRRAKKNYGTTTVARDAFPNVESPREYRLPYRDD